MKFANIYDTARPYIACFVILRKDSKVAMVLRKNTGYYDGHYGLPAGKGEWSETYTDGAIREALEEAGVTITKSDLQFVHVAHRHAEDTAKKEFIDWVDVYFEASSWEGDPYNAEEIKSERLDWIDLNDVPKNVVPPQLEALMLINKGVKYSEYGWQ